VTSPAPGARTSKFDSRVPLSAGVGTVPGWQPARTETLSTTTRASNSWAEGNNIRELCLSQKRALKLPKDWNWRGGSGTGPTNLNLKGSLNLEIRDSKADGIHIASCLTDRTSTSPLTRRLMVVGDGVSLPYSAEPLGKTMPWSHPLSGV